MTSHAFRSSKAHSGPKLLDQSNAHPGNVDLSIFERRAANTNSSSSGQGTVNSQYLTECRQDNPDPPATTATAGRATLSGCRVTTPVEELRLNEDFEVAVDVAFEGEGDASQTSFTLFYHRTKDGQPTRDKIWTVVGKVEPASSSTIVVKARNKLMQEVDFKPGDTLSFEVEATHPSASAPAPSPRTDVACRTLVRWFGGDELHFRNDGEFPLLGDKGALVQILAKAVHRLSHPENGSRETLICFGYASSSGNPAHNRKLSLRRAQAVKALLDRNQTAWADLAKANFETIDIQQFLSDLHKSCGWFCDPKMVDGIDGYKTKRAIEAFQRECNARYKLGLVEDGICGPKTWAAAMRAIHGEVMDALGEDPAKEPSWPKPDWGNGGKGVYANGEDFATGGDKPDERSVQIAFFAPGSEPRLVDKLDSSVTISDNPIHDEAKIERLKLAQDEKVVEVFFRDSTGQKVTSAKPGTTLSLVVQSKGLSGTKIDVNLRSSPLGFSYQDRVLTDGFLRQIPVTGDEMIVPLKVVKKAGQA
ncbi:MAG: hypothetical protein RL173_119 [Fibrobacterota bacterium]|jgi:peptidoglycan hydrolase-like protein with peptidoglycan-binding domain